MSPLMWVRLAIAAAALGALVAAWMTVREWKAAAEQLPDVELQLQQAIADRDAHLEAARQAAAAAAIAEERVDALIKNQPTRIIYREAVSTDPACAEWAATPIACPLDGVRFVPQDPNASAGEGVP